MATRYCDNNHQLVRDLPPSYGCNCCGQLFPRGTVSYRCGTCNFDACPACHSDPPCRGKHIPRRVQLKVAFACDHCSKSFPAGTVSYRCDLCNHDSCETCHGNTPAAKEMKLQQQQQQTTKTVGFTPSNANAVQIPTQPHVQQQQPNGDVVSVPLSPAPGTRSRSLFVGANYFGTTAQLRDSVSNVFTMMKILRAIGFDLSFNKVLVDDRSFMARTGSPDKKSVEAALQWLVEGAKPGDNLFFFFSGHAMTAHSLDDEKAEKDECLVPADFAQYFANAAAGGANVKPEQLQQQKANGLIRDQYLFETFKKLPAGVRLTAIIDATYGNANPAMEAEHEIDFDINNNRISSSKRSAARDAAAAAKRRLAADVVVISVGRTDPMMSAAIEGAGDIANYHQMRQKASNALGGGGLTPSFAEAIAAKIGPDGKPRVRWAEMITRIKDSLRSSGTKQQQRQTQQQSAAASSLLLECVPQVVSSRRINLDGGFSLFGELPK